MKTALTVAGFDPSGGAGLQADLKVFQAHGIYGLSCVSALTAQNSAGVRGVMPVEPAFLDKQLSVLLSDMRPDAVKTGMLWSGENIDILVRAIKKFRLKNIVVDPVMLSSSSRPLAGKGLWEALRDRLLPFCAVITPNIHEASVLSGTKIKSIDDMKKAAVLLHAMGPECVVITGGHLTENATDIIYDGRFTILKGRKLTGEYHGTGCRFSAAITARLAQGYDAHDAVKGAKTFMRLSFKKTFSTGRGMRMFVV
ncbi:MAG: bifunctional hydroxymethylpyrimidine kinase/phosphomethylpyrimidine kinase [Nitrospirae bacterium]|nr:bifunctional hydroxymethylpyrimidine kinase/phosphomethylpyrimidine kinase [Nitrospirota bacterium]